MRRTSGRDGRGKAIVTPACSRDPPRTNVRWVRTYEHPGPFDRHRPSLVTLFDPTARSTPPQPPARRPTRERGVRGVVVTAQTGDRPAIPRRAGAQRPDDRRGARGGAAAVVAARVRRRPRTGDPRGVTPATAPMPAGAVAPGTDRPRPTTTRWRARRVHVLATNYQRVGDRLPVDLLCELRSPASGYSEPLRLGRARPEDHASTPQRSPAAAATPGLHRAPALANSTRGLGTRVGRGRRVQRGFQRPPVGRCGRRRASGRWRAVRHVDHHPRG